MRKHGLTLLVVAAALFSPTLAYAQASDNASNSAYSDGVYNGRNGGTGFNSFVVTNGANSGSFIASSNQNGNGTGPGIDSAGNKAFGLFANSGDTASAKRSFINALAVGQTLNLDFDNGFIDNNSVVGFYLGNSSATQAANAFKFSFTGGDTAYRTTDSGNNAATGFGFTDTGIRTSFTLTSATAYSFSATRLSDSAMFTTTGTLAAGSTIDRFVVFDQNAGQFQQRNVYFNNISITDTPAPPGLLSLLIGVTVAAVRRRRVKRAA